jgi:hypothetical protein
MGATLFGYISECPAGAGIAVAGLFREAGNAPAKANDGTARSGFTCASRSTGPKSGAGGGRGAAAFGYRSTRHAMSSPSRRP